MSIIEAHESVHQHQARPPRRLALLSGKLVYGEHQLTLDCTIRDCSERGARVRLFAAEPLPGRLWFLNLSAGVAYDAQIVWRRFPDIGLVFLEKVDFGQTDTPEARVLHRLMAEAAPRDGNPVR
jgi:hypothetical protein